MKFIIIFLILSFNLYADDKIDKLVANLGHDSFIIREQATEQLKECDYKPIPNLVEIHKTTKDAEIKQRSLIIINAYYKDCFYNVPSIWSLPKEYRYKGEEDISFKYYMEAKSHFDSNTIIGLINWDNEEIKRFATVLYYKDIIKDHPEKTEVLKIKKTTDILEQRHLQLRTQKNWLLAYAEGASIPESIEMLIAKEIADAFKRQFDPEPELAPDDGAVEP